MSYATPIDVANATIDWLNTRVLDPSKTDVLEILTDECNRARLSSIERAEAKALVAQVFPVVNRWF